MTYAKHGQYKVCPDCDAHLDPQERCDCHHVEKADASAHEIVGAAPGRHMLNEYTIHLSGSGLAPHTVGAYTRAVQRLLNFLRHTYAIDANDISGLSAVTEDHLRAYYDSLVSEDKKRSTRNQAVIALKSFFDFHLQAGVISSNAASALLHARARYGEADTKPDEDRFYTQVEVKEAVAFLNAQQSKKAKKRDVALFALLCASAMRINEACSLRISNMDTIRKGYVYVIGKGGALQKVIIAAYALPYLDTYLETRRDAEQDAPLFLSQRNRQLTGNAAWKAFSRFQQPIGLHTGTHICRHTALTHIAHTSGIMAARDAARHKQVSTTNNYVHRLDDVVAHAANESPVAGVFSEPLGAAS